MSGSRYEERYAELLALAERWTEEALRLSESGKADDREGRQRLGLTKMGRAAALRYAASELRRCCTEWTAVDALELLDRLAAAERDE